MGQLSGVSTLLLIVFCLFVMQAIGGYFQIKDYRKSVKRVHKLGNVGIGQKRGKLLSGYLILIACDNNGIITGAEIMEGLSFFAKFKPTNSFLNREMIGTSIYDFLQITRNFDKKQTKKSNSNKQTNKAKQKQNKTPKLNSFLYTNDKQA